MRPIDLGVMQFCNCCCGCGNQHIKFADSKGIIYIIRIESRIAAKCKEALMEAFQNAAVSLLNWKMDFITSRHNLVLLVRMGILTSEDWFKQKILTNISNIRNNCFENKCQHDSSCQNMDLICDECYEFPRLGIHNIQLKIA
jgi:hypothetical protein